MKLKNKSIAKYSLILILVVIIIYLLAPKSMCSDSIGQKSSSENSNANCVIDESS